MVLFMSLCATGLAYQPGLAGGFLFDDYANLPALGATGPTNNTDAFWRYVTSGAADPTGRPITVASFLLDAQNWPTEPHPFKRTNLLIHLLNMTLLAWLLLALGRHSGLVETHAQSAAVLGAAIWGLHPLFVSTTLYIVQREAMLPASFVLAGLLLWLAGRQRLAKGQITFGFILELIGLGLGTLLATLSKANGALLPLFALLIEYLLLRPRDAQPLPRVHRVVVWLLWLPALGLLGYLLHTAANLLGHPAPFGRGWTEAQRLLTEPRVLWDYLRLLWLPRPFTPGLFNDQIHASTSLLHPWTTLPALLGIIGLVASTWALHQRAPLWAFVILFFFAGHLIESTTIPLELYFEHRNYLPALLLFWPLAVWLAAPSETQRGRIILTLVILCGLGAMTHARARVWGDTTEQALLWAKLNPDSPRAQSYAAQIMMARNRPDWALARLRPLLKQAPDQIQIAFNLIGVDCQLGGVPTDDLEATQQALLRTRRLGELSFQWLSHAIEAAQSGSCRGLTLPAVKSLIDAAWANPVTRDTPGWQQDILSLRGRYALVQQQPQAAFQAFSAALLAQPRAATALEQAAMLGSAGQQGLALCELDLWERQPQIPAATGLSMARLHDWVLQRQQYWPHEIAHLRAALRHDLPADQRDMRCPSLSPLAEHTNIQHAH
jgi:hypothetical protein